MIPTHNHLVCKRTLDHLAQLAKWLTCVVSTYLYGAFGCILLSCHLRVSSLYSLPECQATPCSKQAPYRTDKYRTYRTDKYSQNSSIIWPVWLNGWVFVYELSGCGFEFSCSHLIPLNCFLILLLVAVKYYHCSLRISSCKMINSSGFITFYKCSWLKSSDLTKDLIVQMVRFNLKTN